ncbi:MAG: HDIG domain-containing protein [Prevotellaceae bacterium]|nr:HDIG domain-containing protein [Prevotellaceae bacterium]
MSKRNVVLFVYLMMFCGTVFLIFQMFPRKAQFDMQYELGKPWNNVLLTAPFNFPVYKTETELKMENDSINRHYAPYFTISKSKMNSELEKFYTDKSIPDSSAVRYFVQKALQNVYSHCIMNNKTYEELQQKNITEIFLSDSTNIWRKTLLKNVYTIRSAYDFICKHAPVSEEDMHSYNINRFLVDNLIFDKTKSNLALQDLQKNISTNKGMVQAGERIIDRGEIVRYEQFQILNSLKKEFQEHTPQKSSTWVIIGQILMIATLLFLFVLYLMLFRPEFISVKNMFFIIVMILIIIGSASLIMNYMPLLVNIVPFALMAIIIRIFFDSRTALFIHNITVMIVSLFVPMPFMFLLLHISAGMVAISSLKQLTHRAQLVAGAIFIFLIYTIVYTAFVFTEAGSLSAIKLEAYAIFASNALLLLFAYILIYIFEKIFGYLSDVTLVELSNIDNKLLMEFSMKAPGSFQHAIQVSSLAVAAASKINANTLLARTGALYHDIGKMQNPMCFIENQTAGFNPLNNKPYEEAAQIIINHVADGVKVAEQAGLPSQVIAFIKTHHAKSLTRYFYNSAQNASPNKEIDKSKFTYPGQLPETKEEAIVMMSDSVEAASRTLKEFNEESIGNLVENIINAQIADKALQNCKITFRQVEIVKNSLKNSLLNIYHERISYPELNN